jgi:hypothetical protein
MTIQDANAGAIEEVSGRIGLIMADILLIEGEEGETVLELDARLRAEFGSVQDAQQFDSGITLPSEVFPEKCEGFTSYDTLTDLMSFIEDTLAFEHWLKTKLQESCGTSGEEFQAVIDGQQAVIDENTTAKTELLDGFFAEFGAEDQTREEYEAEIDEAFEAAKDGGLESSFDMNNLEIPDSPESCSSITNPLNLEILMN